MVDSEVRYVVRHPDSAGGFTTGRYAYDEVVSLMGGVADAENLLSREVGGYWWDAQYWGVSTATTVGGGSVNSNETEMLRLDRGWVRAEPGWTSGGHPIRVHVVGPDDWSADHVTYPTGYDSRCGWCWLGANHSEAAHAANLADVAGATTEGAGR